MYTRTYCGHIGRGRANVMYEYAVGASGDTGAPEPSGAGAFLEMLCAERAFHLRCFGCLQRVVVVCSVYKRFQRVLILVERSVLSSVSGTPSRGSVIR